MKTRDPIAVTVALLLFGSFVFLASGIGWSLLSEGGTRDGGSAAGSDRTVAADGKQDAANATGAEPSFPKNNGLPQTARIAVGGHAAAEPPADGAELLPQLLIEGRVLDWRARPLADASVHLELRLGSRSADPADTVQQSVTTAADGQFAFVGHMSDDAGISITLLVQAQGHAPHLADHALATDYSALDVGDIELVAGGGITGRVIDAQGGGVPAATVTLQPGSGNPLAALLGTSASHHPEILQPVTSDAAGCFRFANLLPGAYRITASAPKMQEGRLRAPVLVEAGKDIEVEAITLSPGLELIGLVLGAGGEAVSGADVRVRTSASAIRFSDRTTTREDGRFRMQHLPSGALQVEVQATGYLKARADGDAADHHELLIRLEAGIGVTGTVVDSGSSAPVERFAARIRALGSLERGTPAQLLRQQIQTLRSQAIEAKTADDRTRRETMALELEARMIALARSDDTNRPRRVTGDAGAITERPGGRFTFTGLDEGVYAVDIAAPGYAFTSSAPIEVRRDAAMPDLRIQVVPALSLRGVVAAKQDGTPIANATVELMWVDETTASSASGPLHDGSRSARFDWAFASSGPRGDVVMTARTDSHGRFELGPAPPGRYFLSTIHEQAGEGRTEVFELRSNRDDLRILLAPLASVSGQVRNIPEGFENEVVVIAVGGFGTMRTAQLGAVGSYRFDSLRPGRYVIRAVLGEPGDALAKQMTAIFAGDASAVPCNLTLGEGERRELDVTLDVPPVGVVEGSVTINGEPARGFQLVLRHAPSDPAATAVRSMRATLDSRGQFTLRNVPPGDYTLHVSSPASRQEVHREPITVTSGASAWIQAILSVGGLRGRIDGGDDVPADRLEGTLTLLPGASSAPVDLRDYARTHRVHTVRVRAGMFFDDSLTAGPALLIVEIRGRQRAETMVEVPSRTNREIVLTAGNPL